MLGDEVKRLKQRVAELESENKELRDKLKFKEENR